MNITNGDKIELKKKHPCSDSPGTFTVIRTGADIKYQCDICGHIIIADRVKLEKSIKRIIKSDGKP